MLSATSRLALPEPAWSGSFETSTGVSVEGIYFSTEGTPRIVVERYSCWERGDGRCVGTYYILHEPTDFDYPEVLALCDELDVAVPEAFETATPL